jgi:hypothetical protein
LHSEDRKTTPSTVCGTMEQTAVWRSSLNMDDT